MLLIICAGDIKDTVCSPIFAICCNTGHDALLSTIVRDIGVRIFYSILLQRCYFYFVF